MQLEIVDQGNSGNTIIVRADDSKEYWEKLVPMVRNTTAHHACNNAELSLKFTNRFAVPAFDLDDDVKEEGIGDVANRMLDPTRVQPEVRRSIREWVIENMEVSYLVPRYNFYTTTGGLVGTITCIRLELGLIKEQDTLAYGISVVSDKDKPNKRKGLIIALNRLAQVVLGYDEALEWDTYASDASEDKIPDCTYFMACIRSVGFNKAGKCKRLPFEMALNALREIKF